MANDSGVVATLISGGIGATVGGILTAAMQLIGRRAESKAAATELIAKAAGSIVDRLERENEDLRAYIELLLAADSTLPHRIDTARPARKKNPEGGNG